MTDLQAKIVKALANNDMNVTKAAEELYYNRSTVINHIHKIEDETGFNPKKFYDLCKLLKIAEG